MKMSDISTGSGWIIWILVILLGIISATLLLGRGSWFISGYNVASKEEKAEYDEKKLCRTYGIGMSIITALICGIMLLKDVLPAEVVYVAIGIILVVVLAIGILSITFCRRKK